MLTTEKYPDDFSASEVCYIIAAVLHKIKMDVFCRFSLQAGRRQESKFCITIVLAVRECIFL